MDASYEVIKEAVEAASLKCIRADEIQHSQIIDKPMNEHILNEDLVIADLSTSNVNAAYELGVRHALRKGPTIIVAEEQWDFAFDVDRPVKILNDQATSAVGLEDESAVEEYEQKAFAHLAANNLPDWMADTTRDQSAGLKEVTTPSPLRYLS